MFRSPYFIIYELESSLCCGNARPRRLPARASSPHREVPLEPCTSTGICASPSKGKAQESRLWALNPKNFLFIPGKKEKRRG